MNPRIHFRGCVDEEPRLHWAIRDIRDVAAKSAENVARLAALFRVPEHRPSGRIDVDTLTAAAAFITWHLNESRRLLCGLEMPAALSTAIRLDE